MDSDFEINKNGRAVSGDGKTADINTIKVDKTAEQKIFFANRLEKRAKHLRKWAKRTGVSCFRLYDKDIPEIPLAVDIYEDSLYVALYERPYEKPEAEENAWLEEMLCTASEALLIPHDKIYTRTRKKQKGTSQYQKQSNRYKPEPWKNGNGCLIARESGLSFYVNLTDYLDTGLFLDHRPLRSMVREMSAGKRVLNLFSYTGSFSVYAAAGNAARVDSVDLSNTYLDWAQANMALNGLPVYRDAFIRSDTAEFLASARSLRKTWDIIILDPPTFSNSKRMDSALDINSDWPQLVSACISLLSPHGTLFFSTNSRRLKFDSNQLTVPLENVIITDISSKTIPEDFRNTNIHRCFCFTKSYHTD